MVVQDLSDMKKLDSNFFFSNFMHSTYPSVNFLIK